MLFFPIAQQDLQERHPGLANELWSTYTAATAGDSDNLTLTLSSGTTWTLVDTDASFADSVAGLYGVIVGFWGFKVTTKDSTTQLTIEVLPYPVGSIVQADLDTDVMGNYSIGGYARQMIVAGEEIVKDLTRKRFFPEAFDWTERNRHQLEPVFCYKTLELITFDLVTRRDDPWSVMSDKYRAAYLNELNDLLVSYQPENEDTDNDNFERIETIVRR